MTVRVRATANAARSALRLLYLATAVLLAWRLVVARQTRPLDAAIERLWPIQWLGHLPFGTTEGVATCLVVAGIVASLLWQSRTARVLVAIASLVVTAWFSSFGKVNHNDHMLLWTLAVLAAIPTAAMRTDATRRSQLDLLVGFARAQAVVLFFYFMAGLLKVLGGLVQWSLGEPNLFRLDAMPRQLAARLMQTDSQSAVGDWLIDHPHVATPLLWTAVVLECGSLFVIARGLLHRLWGLALIGLHLGIGLAMTIWFDTNFLVLFCLLVLSPFDRPASWRQRLARLPGAVTNRRLQRTDRQA